MTIPQALQIALQHHQAGRFADAEALYRQILAAQPNHFEALRLLGVIAYHAGRHELAVELLRQSIVLDPTYSPAHCLLGEACQALGWLEEAVTAYRRALELKPDFPEAHNNLGNACRDLGQLDEALAAYRQALQFQPDLAEAHNNAGIALVAQGQRDEAEAAYRRALEIKPNFPEAHNNLGSLLRERGHLEEAVAACRRALELKPDYPEAHSNLAAALAAQGLLDEAIALYRRAIQLRPGFTEAFNDLGVALRDIGQLDEAIASYRRALELKPDSPETYNNLGIALKEQGELDEAIAAIRRAIQLKPDFPEAFNNLGNTLKDRGELDEAVAALRHALRLSPGHSGFHSNLVFALHFHPCHDAGTISEEQRRWSRQFSDPLKQCRQPHANDRNPERRLRIGYVSPDFRDHAVGRYVLPLLEGHDRQRFEILCYSGVARPDGITGRLRALAGEWRSTLGVSDAHLAQRIREDGVDILVDLSMHTAGSRLPVFARQPAPVQVTWLAYPGGAGLREIGYRLTDAHMDPVEERVKWPAEEPVRLPGCWCCYQAANESPEINALPALSAEGFTFGSLNAFAKLHEGVLILWARTLEAVRGSRLLMFCPEGRARERVRAFFGQRGIGVERVEFVGFLPHSDYLRLYHRIDLGLDPFPYNGMTTTCDALWMGVPVLTLPGKMPVSRAGLSLLSNVGLGEFAASSEDDYVRVAAELAANLPRLSELRSALRSRMQASPLMDAPRFARNVEAAYRSMWRAWCIGAFREAQGPEPIEAHSPQREHI